MENNNKTLLIAVLIILLALVAFNFNKISGSVSQDLLDIGIVVSPTVIKFDRDDGAKIITVTVNAGNIGLDGEGLDKQIELYEVENTGRRDRVAGKTWNLCNTNICTGTISKNLQVGAEVPSGRYVLRLERDNYDIEVYSNEFIIRHIG